MKTATRGQRRGILLVEILAAGAMLAILLGMTVQVVGWIAAERRSTERRGWALQEAANAMERLAGMPYDRLSSETARASVRLSAPAQEVLPGGDLAAEVTDDAALPMKRIDVSVRWRGASGLPEAPVRLTSWVARKGGGR